MEKLATGIKYQSEANFCFGNFGAQDVFTEKSILLYCCINFSSSSDYLNYANLSVKCMQKVNMLF